MAEMKQERLLVRNAQPLGPDGQGYDLVHFETESEVVYRANGTTVEDALVDHTGKIETKADGMEYKNGQLQLKSGPRNVGLPVDITVGGVISAFMSGVNNFKYTATVDNVLTFQIPAEMKYDSTKVVTLIRDNLTLVRGTDYSVSSSGLVTLTDALKATNIVNGIINDTSFDANNLSHKEIFVGPSTTYPLTIQVSDWIGTPPTYSLLHNKITSTNIVEIYHTEAATDDQIKMMQNANIVHVSQRPGWMVLKCLGDKPTTQLPFLFVIRSDT